MLVGSSVAADDNHYQSILIGERAAGLAGAFTAISDDSSGAYYNPAGLAEADHASFSLAVAVYGVARQSFLIEREGVESDNSNFISYPTTAAWIQRLRQGDEQGAGRIQAALSIVTPQSDVSRKRYSFPSVAQEPGLQIRSQQVVVHISEDDTMWIGLSAAWKVFRRLSIGATLYTTIRSGLYKVHNLAMHSLHDDQSGAELGRIGVTEGIDIEFSHYGLLGLFGLVVPITDRLRLGASFRTPSAEIGGDASWTQFATTREESGEFKVASLEVDGAFHQKHPFKATLGGAYIVPRRYGVSLDFSIHGPVDKYMVFASDADPELDTGVYMKKRLTWQLNAGGEYYLARVVPLRLGFFTNLSSYDPFEACVEGVCGPHSNFLTSSLDMFGFAGSVGYEMDRATLNLGWSYSFGSQEETVGEGLKVEEDSSVLFLSIGGSFRF